MFLVSVEGFLMTTELSRNTTWNGREGNLMSPEVSRGNVHPTGLDRSAYTLASGVFRVVSEGAPNTGKPLVSTL